LTKSEKLFERAKTLIPGGVNSPVRAFAPYPFFTASSRGSHIRDVDGKDYIDYCLAYGPLILGHSPPVVIEAVRAQLGKGTLYGTPTVQEVELAELICEAVPSAEMVRLVTTGAEATMSAIRAARAYTGRKKVVKFEGCYHGAYDSMLVKAGSGATTFGIPDSLGVPAETTSNTVVCPFNNLESLQKIVKEEKDNLAAVIMEPVIGNIGVVPPRKGYLKGVRELTEENDVVLILDEMITGFRLAFGGAQEYYGVEPDVTTLGKILGGGFPLAAFAGQKEIIQMIAPAGKAYQAGTYSGNPISVTAALVTLKALKRGGKQFYQKLEAKQEKITSALKRMTEEHGVAAQVNSVGSMFQIFFTNHRVYDYGTAKTSNTQLFIAYHTRLLKNRIFIPPSQFETCFISSEHSDQDVKETIDAAEKIFGELSS
jgi:glutamate-1-semialdehyde 2,1-aminomutase